MSTRSFDEATPYRIRVEGRLGEEWSVRFGGMKLVVHETGGAAGATDLTGWITDQAALMGLLEQLYSRGATLLRVERLEAGADPEGQDPGGSAGRKTVKGTENDEH
jgi:hypothetical protein